MNEQPQNYLSRNLTALLKNNNTNEMELAKQLNVTYNTIHRLVSGNTADPKLSTLQQIADYFNVGIDTLLNNHINQLNAPVYTAYNLPVITLEQAQSFNSAQNISWEKWLPVATSTAMPLNDNCYAVESSRSMQPRFPIGTAFVVNPDASPIDGDLVLVKFINDNRVSVRELIIDSPDWRLQSIIPGSRELIFDKAQLTIIGVVVLTIIQTRNV